MTVTYALIAFSVALALSLGLTPLVRRIALQTGHVAAPKATRWHKRPTALLGGIAIFVAAVGSWLTVALALGWQTFAHPYLPVILCATGMFVLGLVDDLKEIKPQHKLAGQVVLASLLMLFGFRLDWLPSDTLDLIVSIVWAIGITNALNLLDNMDGLAAGIALIAGSFLIVAHVSTLPIANAQFPFIVLGSAYVGALLGFLFYNFHPASIFMGDAGSLFIGFVLACLGMTPSGIPAPAKGGLSLNLVWTMAVPMLILLIPILDTALVSVTRKLFRKPISQGGRDHSSHRLVAIGLSERKSVAILYVFSASSGLVALVLPRLSTEVSVILVVLYLLFVLFYWIYLGRVKVYPEKSILLEPGSARITPLLLEVTYRRRLFEVLLDLVLVSVAYYAAYLLRFEGDIGGDFPLFLQTLPLVIACQILAFYVFGVYRGVWAAVGIRDMLDYIKAVTAGAVVPMLLLLFLYRFGTFSRAVFVIYWGLMVLLVGLSRFSFRLFDEGVRKAGKTGKPAIIYGAGAGGQLAVREIEGNPAHGFHILGFVDDDPTKKGLRVRGYPVLGAGENLRKILLGKEVKVIIISFKAGAGKKCRDLQRFCSELGIEVEIRQMTFSFDQPL